MSDLVRVEELLAQRAVEGLDDAERAELERLLDAHPGYDADALDRAAAALLLATLGALQPMPASLRARLESASAAD